LRPGITQRVMRKRKGRFERHHLLELRDGAIEIVTEMVHVANLRLHLKIERIEPLRFLELNEREVVTLFEQGQPPCIPQMRRCRASQTLPIEPRPRKDSISYSP